MASVFCQRSVLVIGLIMACVTTAHAQQCKAMWKSINFDDMTEETPYTLPYAERDFAPYEFMDGYYDDPGTLGTNKRRVVVKMEGNNPVLDALMPKGCVTKKCGMQVKHRLAVSMESATLSYKVKFGPGFDWVRGGKLPGLCGGKCQTGCKTVSGLDGWSARNMWRSCQWPPVHEMHALKCTGGKLVSYVYHMDKVHWCGDDFSYEHPMFKKTLPSGQVTSLMQPQPDKWYEITEHVKMNTAGPPGQGKNFKRDGVLQTWIDGVLVVDKQEMGWRQYNNVTIDTFYFSLFFGGSSPSFQASKDEHIRFDQIKIYEGTCPPGSPKPTTIAKRMPTWDGQISKSSDETTLKSSLLWTTSFNGGGCGDIVIENKAAKDTCTNWVVEVNIDPTWGRVDRAWAATKVEEKTEQGWSMYTPGSDKGLIIPPGASFDKMGICIKAHTLTKYLPDQFFPFLVTSARCTTSRPFNAVVDTITTKAYIPGQPRPAAGPKRIVPNNPLWSTSKDRTDTSKRSGRGTQNKAPPPFKALNGIAPDDIAYKWDLGDQPSGSLEKFGSSFWRPSSVVGRYNAYVSEIAKEQFLDEDERDFGFGKSIFAGDSARPTQNIPGSPGSGRGSAVKANRLSIAQVEAGRVLRAAAAEKNRLAALKAGVAVKNAGGSHNQSQKASSRSRDKNGTTGKAPPPVRKQNPKKGIRTWEQRPAPLARKVSAVPWVTKPTWTTTKSSARRSYTTKSSASRAAKGKEPKGKPFKAKPYTSQPTKGKPSKAASRNKTNKASKRGRDARG